MEVGIIYISYSKIYLTPFLRKQVFALIYIIQFSSNEHLFKLIALNHNTKLVLYP